MRLYHLSTDCNIKYFYTRVPESRIKEENDDIPRICVAHSLGSCFLGWSGAYKRHVKGGMICALYEFNIDEDKKKFIKATHELEGLVPDAEDTRELWITDNSIKPTTKYIIAVHEVKFNFQMTPKVEYTILYKVNLGEG